MKAQKKRAREAHKSVDILVNESDESSDYTEFCGYDLSNFKILTLVAPIG